MITKWKLKNFKSVRESTDLVFGPLTILAGSNSSGKSTVIQSILLINQTLSSRISSRSVVLNGPLVKLGQFDDLKSFNSNQKNISIGWEIIPKEKSDLLSSPKISKNRFLFMRENKFSKICCDLKFDAKAMGENPNVSQLQPKIVSNYLQWGIMEGGEEKYYEISINRSRNIKGKIKKYEDITNIERESYFHSFEYDVNVNQNLIKDLEERQLSFEIIGIRLRHFLPIAFLVVYDNNEILAHQIATRICNLWKPFYRRLLDEDDMNDDDNNESLEIPIRVLELVRNQFDQSLQEKFNNINQSAPTIKELLSVLKSLTVQQRREYLEKIENNDLFNSIVKVVKEEKGEDYQLRYDRVPYRKNVSGYVQSYFSFNINYLGPLRDEPRPLYPLAPGNDPYDIGIKGEHTAAVFDLYKDKEVVFIKSDCFKSASVKPHIETQSLKSAIIDWLTYLDVAEDVISQDRGKIGHELKVTTEGSSKGQDLTHVGVGISQVLPILVMCLLADPYSTIIIEQPELHLHPKVQSLLADFLLSMTMLEKQCIIETHSEYIINRLRFRAAAADETTISDLMKIYFVEKKNGQSTFRSVDVNKYGAIMDWPEGFFDQSQSEAEEILRAATKKHKVEKGK